MYGPYLDKARPDTLFFLIKNLFFNLDYFISIIILLFLLFYSN